MKIFTISSLLFILLFNPIIAENYHIGPDYDMKAIADAPWDALNPGDTVFIHWRDTPYKEKWIINLRGTEENPIVVSGVANDNGELPEIDGNNATTPLELDFWNEVRGIIKIGGASYPNTETAAYIIIENLDIHTGRPGYYFTDDAGSTQEYVQNCAAVYVDIGENITVRNCMLHDCGNGIFVSSASSDIVFEYNYIYDNGIEGDYYEHNNYTSATNITFQFNYFGALRDGCDGNNLKDRSAGTVIRYNWIEDGNRQLDLVDAGEEALYNNSIYRSTYVYGNVLVENDGQGNSQIIHYGGDSQDLTRYRKGTLYLFNNTVISTRGGNTTLVRLSSEEESCVCFNNIIYVTADGSKLAMLNDEGTISLENNYMKPGWVKSHSTDNGTINNLGNIEAESPGFTDFGSWDLTPSESSVCFNAGKIFSAEDYSGHYPLYEYIRHRKSQERAENDIIDIGAYESDFIPEAVNEIANNAQLKILPNPFNDVCRILVPVNSSIEIIDILGNIVYRKDNVKFSLISWKPAEESAKGTYYLRCRHEGNLLSKMIVFE